MLLDKNSRTYYHLVLVHFSFKPRRDGCCSSNVTARRDAASCGPGLWPQASGAGLGRKAALGHRAHDHTTPWPIERSNEVSERSSCLIFSFQSDRTNWTNDVSEGSEWANELNITERSELSERSDVSFLIFYVKFLFENVNFLKQMFNFFKQMSTFWNQNVKFFQFFSVKMQNNPGFFHFWQLKALKKQWSRSEKLLFYCK